MIAAENNQMDVIVPLLQHGADVNLQDDLGIDGRCLR
jgi:ankyrin repeat protein